MKENNSGRYRAPFLEEARPRFAIAIYKEIMHRGYSTADVRRLYPTYHRGIWQKLSTFHAYNDVSDLTCIGTDTLLGIAYALNLDVPGILVPSREKEAA